MTKKFKSTDSNRKRFVWKTDRNGLWSFPARHTDPIINQFQGVLAGRDLAHISGDQKLDPIDPLTAALYGTNTFATVEVTWTGANNETVGTLQFWGTPCVSASNTVEGFQGFAFFTPVSSVPASPIDREPTLAKVTRQPSTQIGRAHV